MNVWQQRSVDGAQHAIAAAKRQGQRPHAASAGRTFSHPLQVEHEPRHEDGGDAAGIPSVLPD